MNMMSAPPEVRPSQRQAHVDFASPDLPMMLPGRPKMRYDLPKAWRHFKELVKDKEDTSQVAPIFEALPWRGIYDAALGFLATERGQEIRRKEPSLMRILDDHEALRKMPEGSLAHAYCDFMEREGLSAEGLVDELDKNRPLDMYWDDQVSWYFNRMRDTHDLMHIITGFGRDALGEQCVLAFTYSQQPSLAHLFLGYAGGLEIRKHPVKVPVFRSVREAQKMGKACPRLVEMAITDLLPLSLDEVRRKLNIDRPRNYWAAHATWRAAGVDPYDLMAPVKQAA
ncbi:ubiquinone biosynthesis protein COQ4 [Novosphingobium kunmingense]|uniref:Ubiquinone biosynthesis protein COQ4 n=1 Tax=Novosphingobium kunmingense TaxID=1211806 RepID=A0A2N0I216_9SPHN|nr:ubiquinone biosynthesis protein COQ4 [Novosphingobium kunmingense]PKB25221.1 ubiquinone biosynthesis protein COQ4 [Novosphingobium kunmingense]